MKITITGRHLGVTEAMKAYARGKVEKLERYFDRPTGAHVTMDVEHDSHQVEIVLDLVRNAKLTSRSGSPPTAIPARSFTAPCSRTGT